MKHTLSHLIRAEADIDAGAIVDVRDAALVEGAHSEQSIHHDQLRVLVEQIEPHCGDVRSCQVDLLTVDGRPEKLHCVAAFGESERTMQSFYQVSLDFVLSPN